MKNILRFPCFALLFVISGCAYKEATRAVKPTEVVLHPGEELAFKNANGSGTIRYVGELEREYTFDGKSYKVSMIPRDKRFLGKMGMYNPASRSVFAPSFTPRIVALEAETHFNSVTDAMKELRSGSAVMKWVYNREGYVVGFSKSPYRGDQINISLFRFLIKGAPANLPGADDKAVVLH